MKRSFSDEAFALTKKRADLCQKLDSHLKHLDRIAMLLIVTSRMSIDELTKLEQSQKGYDT